MPSHTRLYPDCSAAVIVPDTYIRLLNQSPCERRMRKSKINAEGLRAYAADLKLLEDGRLTEDEIEQAVRQFGGSIGGGI